MAATTASNEWESTLGALRMLGAGRAAARVMVVCVWGLLGDGMAARSGWEVAGMVGEWMEGVEEAWEEE